jgi:chorismate-pyruvate lyase
MSHPALTRMLLASDGSTTQLLEALLDAPLVVRVEQQRRMSASGLPQRIRDALTVSPCDVVMNRRSQLLQDDGGLVSINHVVARWLPDDVLASIMTNHDEPIGRAMRRNEMAQSRRILDAGIGVWNADPSKRPCAFKKYVIVRDGTPTIYVHETFNPDHVPVCRAVGPSMARI